MKETPGTCESEVRQTVEKDKMSLRGDVCISAGWQVQKQVEKQCCWPQCALQSNPSLQR